MISELVVRFVVVGADSGSEAVDTPEEDLPSDPEALRALHLIERAARIAAEARSSAIDAKLTEMKLEIARLNRETYGQWEDAARSAPIACLSARTDSCAR